LGSREQCTFFWHRNGGSWTDIISLAPLWVTNVSQFPFRNSLVFKSGDSVVACLCWFFS
jgi:hypothetical protein